MLAGQHWRTPQEDPGVCGRILFATPSRDIRQVLNAELSSAWVMLENCRPKRMKGYGVEFDPAARAALEESVEHLVAQVIALRAKIR